MVVNYYIEIAVEKRQVMLSYEIGKLTEKRMNLITESFENIRTIKLYGWDKYF